MKVLVYGDWKDQSANIVPFFTASFSEDKKKEFIRNFRSLTLLFSREAW